jgi:HPt (histidine-containing phosphotransfer) domain-containing protein
VREKLNLLLEKHCVTIKNNVELLGEHLNRAQQDGAAPQDALSDAGALAHQLKGSSGTAGFHDICVAATALNDHLNAIKGRAGAPLRQGVIEAIELYESLSRASKAASPQSSALYLVAS